MLPYHMLALVCRDELEPHHATATNNIWCSDNTQVSL